MLYLVQNKIGKVDEGELDWCKETMTSIELGGNRMRVGPFYVVSARWLMDG